MTNDTSSSSAGSVGTNNTENANPPALRRAGAYKKTVSMGPFPRLIFIGACIAVVACLAWLAWPTAAFAQGAEAGVTVSPQHLAVPEGGSAEYTVVLKTRPIAVVTITVRRKLGGGETDLTATPASLTFTGSNWDTRQTVTVWAAEDDDSEDGTQEFEHPVVSDDAAYGGKGAPVVRATEEDNDTAGVTVSPRRLEVPEGGSAGYTVVLDTQPLFDVEITVTRGPGGGDADLTATPDSLTFTNSNWDTPQTVTVSAAEDDNDKLDGSATFEHATQSDDDSYEGDAFAIESVTATEDDNDKADQTLAGFAYSASQVTYGDTAPTVTAPSGAQTEVTYSASPGTVCSVDSGSGALTITGAGECTITATAAETADYDAASATFKLTVNKADQTLEGFAYVPAMITLGDTAPMVTAPSGAQAEVTYSASPGTVCGVDSGSGALTITGAGECTITATAAETADYDAASATFKLTVNKADQTLEGFAYVPAMITLGDTAPMVTAPSGAQAEVTYSASPGTVCGVDSGSGALTITGAGECTITATAAETADYKEGTATFRVTVAENDAPTANAGADRTAAEGAEVTLDGTKSSDPEGADLTFTWTQTAPESGAGSGVTLDTTDPSRPTFTAPTELLEDAVLTFSLTVSDGLNTSEADTVDITVTVGRNDAALSGLEISAGTLTPAFDVETTHYSVGVRNAVANVTVAPTTRYHGATVTVNGTTVDRNSASSAIDLAEKAETRIPVVVTAQNTRTTKTYIIAVTRALAALADLSAAPGGAQVVLTWADPGNSTITKYQVSTDGGETFTDMRGSSATAATYTVTGLTNGTEYTFQVRAVNASGAGAASSSATATPLWPAPTRLAATPGDGEVELTWDRNPGIAHYRVDIQGDGVSEAQFVSPGSESKTTATITELTNGTKYTFTVRAVEGSVDTGRPSALNATPLARSDAPDAPMVLSAAADVAEVALTWADPGDDTITRYQVSTDSGETFTDIPDSSADTDEYTATGLTNGEEYRFAVRAQNVSGEGAASTAIATPLWPAPDKLAATPDSGRVHLQWDRNPGITNYRVDTTVTATDELYGSSTISAGSESKTTATIFGLTNGDEYSFTVRAVKDAVDISPPSSLNATPAAPATEPAAPTDLSATPSDRQVKLSWDNPNNLTIIRHEVRWKVKNSDNSSYTAWAVSDAATEHTVTGLTNGTEHQLQVRAVNGLGNGAASTASATPMLLARFGAASYGAEEGGDAVTVEVTLSERAAASLEVPITVTPRGETVASDYVVDGIDAGMLAFAKGDDTRTFTIKANQDDDFDDETVILGFGTLDGVLAGTPATAVLTITDDEGAAIRARFRRLNDEILSKHALTIADVTNRAIGARMDEACGDQAVTYSLAGGSTIDQALRSTAWAIEDGTLTLDDALAGSSFLLPLGAANDDRAGGPGGSALWGRGDRQTLESRNSAFAWDGTVLTGQLGIDGCLGEDLVTGMTLSHSLGAFDYTDGTGPAPVSGAYESRMNSVHPYLGWSSPRGLGLWGTVGYGWGEIEIDDEQVRRGDPGDPVKRSDTTLKTAALGARGPVMTDGSLIAGGTTRVMVKGEASVARVEVDGDDELIEKQTVNANRLRMALEGSHEQALASGSSLTTSLELGLRHDGGDGITGGGIEIGGGLRYRDPAAGLTIEGNGRVLTGQGDYREWGLGGSLRLDPGADGRGMSLSVAPVYGDVSSGVARLWDQDVAELAANDRAADDSRPQGRLEAELGYGLPALGGHGLLTPYGGFSLVGDEGQLYRLGGRLEIGSAVTLGLEGERRKDGSDGAVDHGVMLRGQVRW